MAKTIYFSSYEEFLNRDNKSLNGTSDPSKVDDGSSNIGCWNCIGCSNCVQCSNCEQCTNCANCIECNNCDGCTRCIDCKECTYCRHCKSCNRGKCAIDAIGARKLLR